jgi:(p)ppGpp synthase/HD superfamily hydrolase
MKLAGDPPGMGDFSLPDRRWRATVRTKKRFGEETTVLTQRFAEALVWVMHLHGQQVRKGTQIPYLAHLLAVASLVLEHGATENEAIAALLHDAIEDQGGAATREQIRLRFGPTVERIVVECSDAETTPKPPWRERKEAYIARIAAASPSARLVSMADKLHNARSILADYRLVGDALWARFTGGCEGTLWYYRTLADTYRAVQPHPLADELARVVAEIERLVSCPEAMAPAATGLPCEPEERP